MIRAEWFTLDGMLVECGQFSPLGKNLFRATLDAIALFGGDIEVSSRHFYVIGIDNKRLIISLDKA